MSKRTTEYHIEWRKTGLLATVSQKGAMCISQGSVATRSRCGGIFIDDFFYKFTAESARRWKIWRSYRQYL